MKPLTFMKRKRIIVKMPRNIYQKYRTLFFDNAVYTTKTLNKDLVNVLRLVFYSRNVTRRLIKTLYTTVTGNFEVEMIDGRIFKVMLQNVDYDPEQAVYEVSYIVYN